MVTLENDEALDAGAAGAGGGAATEALGARAAASCLSLATDHTARSVAHGD